MKINMCLKPAYIFLSIVIAGMPMMVIAQPKYDSEPMTSDEIRAENKVFDTYVNRYVPDSSAVKLIRSIDEPVKILIFLGFWCNESLRYIPGLTKSLLVAQNPKIEHRYIRVDEEKKIPSGLLKKFDIKYIPTAVILKRGKEAGRIEESPLDRIELDLVRLMKD